MSLTQILAPTALQSYKMVAHPGETLFYAFIAAAFVLYVPIAIVLAKWEDRYKPGAHYFEYHRGMLPIYTIAARYLSSAAVCFGIPEGLTLGWEVGPSVPLECDLDLDQHGRELCAMCSSARRFIEWCVGGHQLSGFERSWGWHGLVVVFLVLYVAFWVFVVNAVQRRRMRARAVEEAGQRVEKDSADSNDSQSEITYRSFSETYRCS